MIKYYTVNLDVRSQRCHLFFCHDVSTSAHHEKCHLFLFTTFCFCHELWYQESESTHFKKYGTWEIWHVLCTAGLFRISQPTFPGWSPEISRRAAGLYLKPMLAVLNNCVHIGPMGPIITLVKYGSPYQSHTRKCICHLCGFAVLVWFPQMKSVFLGRTFLAVVGPRPTETNWSRFFGTMKIVILWDLSVHILHSPWKTRQTPFGGWWNRTVSSNELVPNSFPSGVLGPA